MVTNGSQFNSVDEIQIKISMDIIEHFSKNLYRTSTKALEELVTNGYDAIANNVHIYLPGEYVKNRVVVWDDGDSMDIQGLKSLWHIAASPKAKTNREVKTRAGGKRDVIGKFGIGKLASYSLGSEISHLCKKNKEYYLISINYDELQRDLPSEKSEINTKSNHGYKQKIYQLSESEASTYTKNLFVTDEMFNSEMFNKDSWTIAIIDSLKTDVKIQQGIIKRVLSRSMPLKPDFAIYINEQAIESLLLVQNAILDINFNDSEFQKKLKNNWAIYLNTTDEEEELTFKKDSSAVIFPNLGLTTGSIRLSSSTLRDGAAAKIDRLYGFFIYVKERLINPEDDLLFLNDPSFATFYRSQFIIHCNGLDDVLLADRERFSNSKEIEEFKILQKSCYQCAVAKWTSEVKKTEESRQFKNRLPIHRKELFADPISFLWSKEMKSRQHIAGQLEFNLEDPTVEIIGLGFNEDVSKFRFEGNKPKLIVNQEHPFFDKQKNTVRNNRVGKQILGELENLLAMESMFEGYLRYLELDEPFINSIVNWRKSMYRQLAIGTNKTIDGAIEEMKSLSYSGNRDFEEAVCNVLNMIGFKARVEGNAGNPDIVAEAYLGEDTYRLIFETKGSKHAVTNPKAAVAAAPSHAKMVQAEHAVIIAREFTGFSKSVYPALLKECDSINRLEHHSTTSNDLRSGNISKYIKEKSLHPTVSIMTVENLASLALATYQYRYDLSTIKSIFTELEHPNSKSDRINKLKAPENGFDFMYLLEKIYEYQYKIAHRPFARISEIYDHFYATGERGVESQDEFDLKISALTYFAYPFVNRTEDEIILTSKPDIVLTHITNRLSSEKIESE